MVQNNTGKISNTINSERIVSKWSKFLNAVSCIWSYLSNAVIWLWVHLSNAVSYTYFFLLISFLIYFVFKGVFIFPIDIDKFILEFIKNTFHIEFSESIKELIRTQEFYFRLSILIILYIPISALNYCFFRHTIRKDIIKINLKCLGVKENSEKSNILSLGYDACTTNISRLILPATLATIIALSGLSVLFFGENSSIASNPNIFLGGMKAISQQKSNQKDDIYILEKKVQSLLKSLNLIKSKSNKDTIKNITSIIKRLNLLEKGLKIIKNNINNINNNDMAFINTLQDLIYIISRVEINVNANISSSVMQEANRSKFVKNLKDIQSIITRIIEQKPNTSKLIEYQKGAILMAGMAFLGAILWGIQNIVRRYVVFDINSHVYYSLSVRILLSGTVAVIFYHSLDGLTDGLLAVLIDTNANKISTVKNTQPSAILPSVGFFIGMFPQRGLIWLKDRVKIFSDTNPSITHLPLDLIPGITYYDVVRLREISIDNCYELAHRRLIPLLLLMPYDPLMLIDWILKAKLYAYFPEEIKELRAVGICDVTDLSFNNCKFISKPKDTKKILIKELKNKTGLTESRLLSILNNIDLDKQVNELIEFRKKLSDNKLLTTGTNNSWASWCNNAKKH